MRFEDIIGHHTIKKHLIDTYQQGRTAHAQIFLGPEGCGKLALAVAYAQYLLCEQPIEQDSCGQCITCKKVQKLIHPDLHFSFPVVGAGNTSNSVAGLWREQVLENPYFSIHSWLLKQGAENQRPNISKKECVEIVRKLSFKATEGRFKIMILWLPEYLGNEGNRLLKLIEEPQPNTVFILVAEQSEKILNTILSRCQLVAIPRLTDDELTLFAQNRFELDHEHAQTLAYLAEGNICQLQQLIEHTEWTHSKHFLEWLRICFKGASIELVRWVEAVVGGKVFFQTLGEIKMGRKEQLLFFQYGLFFFRECLVLAATNGNSRCRLLGDEEKAAMRLAQILKMPQFERIMGLCNDAIYAVERNAHPKILLLDTCIQLHRILRNKVSA